MRSVLQTTGAVTGATYVCSPLQQVPNPFRKSCCGTNPKASLPLLCFAADQDLGETLAPSYKQSLLNLLAQKTWDPLFFIVSRGDDNKNQSSHQLGRTPSNTIDKLLEASQLPSHVHIASTNLRSNQKTRTKLGFPPGYSRECFAAPD